MSMQIELLSIVLIRGRQAADTAILTFHLPDGCHPFTGNGYATMHIAANQGESYCKRNFPDVPIEVIPPV